MYEACYFDEMIIITENIVNAQKKSCVALVLKMRGDKKKCEHHHVKKCEIAKKCMFEIAFFRKK